MDDLPLTPRETGAPRHAAKTRRTDLFDDRPERHAKPDAPARRPVGRPPKKRPQPETVSTAPAAENIPSPDTALPTDETETTAVRVTPILPETPPAPPKKPRRPHRKPATVSAASEADAPEKAPEDSPVTDAAEHRHPFLRRSRVTRGGHRRGRHVLAAPVGFLVLLLAAWGVVSLTITAVRGIKSAAYNAPLRTEISDFVEPVTTFCPVPFSDVNQQPQDALLKAAIWRLTNQERIRQLNSTFPKYEEDNGRLVIPAGEVAESYAALFGKDAKLTHRTIEGSTTFATISYDDVKKNYLVYLNFASATDENSIASTYTTVIGKLSHRGAVYQVQLGFIPTADLRYDKRGKVLDPTIDQAKYTQTYTLRRLNGGRWTLTAIKQP